MRLGEPLIMLLGLLLPVVYVYLRRRGGDRLLAASRVVILLLLVLAAANPMQVQEVSSEVQVPRLTVIEDETRSMDMFRDRDVAPEWNRSEVRRLTLTGNSSPVGDAVERAASGGGGVLLYSDGRVTEGTSMRGAVLEAARRNVTVNVVRPEPMGSDVAVEVKGPKNVVAGENLYSVVVRSTSNATYRLRVSVDGETVIDRDLEQTRYERRVNFTLDVGEGSHTMEAEVSPGGDDVFPENDRFVKSIWGAPEPEVLLVDGGSSLGEVLDEGYRVTESDEVGELDGFKTVVLNDVSEGELTRSELDRLTDFVAEGGGLVVVGGRSSYNFGDYLNSSFETILPVRSSPSRFFGGTNLVLVIDISRSTNEGAFGGGAIVPTVLEVEKSNAVNLIRNLERGDRVSAVTFGGKGFTILPTRGGWVEASESGVLEEKIRRISSKSSSGGTVLSEGLLQADVKLAPVGGSKSVVVLTDGGIDDLNEARAKVESLKSQGVNLAIIKIRTGEPREEINELASLTGTPLYEVEAGQTASVELDEEPKPPDAGDRDEFGLSTSGVDHFVTRGLSLDSSITGYNDVTPKPASDLLVATDTGRPVLTTWSYGLGRVAALSTDDGVAWAPELYSEDGLLMTRTVNWAVEDPRQRDGVLVMADDGWVASPLTVRVEADELPDLSLGGTGIGMSRRDGYYSGTVVPRERGVFDLAGYPVAVNYPEEIRRTGFDEDVEELVGATGGEVVDSADDLSEEDLTGESDVRRTEEVSLRWIPLVAALLLLVVDVSYRRWREVRGTP